jgi:hypothetical protein
VSPEYSVLLGGALGEFNNPPSPEFVEPPFVALRPSQVKGSKELDNSASGVISRPPQEMATVDFQFGAGEVIITRKATNGGSTNSGDGGLLNSPNAPPNNTPFYDMSFVDMYSKNTLFA